MKAAAVSTLFVLAATLGVLLFSQPAESQDKQQTPLENRINSLWIPFVS